MFKNFLAALKRWYKRWYNCGMYGNPEGIDTGWGGRR